MCGGSSKKSPRGGGFLSKNNLSLNRYLGRSASFRDNGQGEREDSIKLGGK